ncbi:hypothetical protein BU17DRAFT_89847 [Hysterangium stoloniferum]|nr:hypothetical protein BU17DRAFT_89847 [Hysterangium stoloniferum]
MVEPPPVIALDFSGRLPKQALVIAATTPAPTPDLIQYEMTNADFIAHQFNGEIVFYGRKSLMEGIWEVGMQVERYIVQAAQGVVPHVNNYATPHAIPMGKCAAIGMPPPEISSFEDLLTQKAKEKCLTSGTNCGWIWAEDPVAPPAYFTRPSWSLADQIDSEQWTLLDILRIRDRRPIRYPSIDENLSRLLFEKVNGDVAKETHIINCPTPPLFSSSSGDSDDDIPFAK